MNLQFNRSDDFNAARQAHYDRLHHLRRVVLLSSKRSLDMVELTQLRQSKLHLSGSVCGGATVDLANSAYLAELDRFAMSAEAKVKIN